MQFGLAWHFSGT